MPINASGPLNITDLVNEFGGSVPHSLSEYYRGGSLVANGAQNVNVPTSGPISLNNFRRASRTVLVTYQIIGGGGSGGYGLEDGTGSGSGGKGGNSSISGGGISIFATGGSGGANGDRFGGGSAGQSTAYGAGGAAIGNGASGNPAPATSYGAGGGGAGGDDGGTYDSSGAGGQGGFAGVLLQGTFTVAYGQVLSIVIGGGGVSSGGVYQGGRGAGGFCRLSFDSKTVDFTTNVSYTVI